VLKLLMRELTRRRGVGMQRWRREGQIASTGRGEYRRVRTGATR